MNDSPTPEERMAQRLSKLNAIVPPIDIFSLAKSLASTQTLPFPSWINADVITLNLKIPGRRTHILINERIGYHRKRFTAAHEIGHIIIPWHIGDIVDDISVSEHNLNSRYRILEAEANRFAAEILMPRDWVESLCQQVDHLRGALITVAEVADVSLSAAALRIIQLGPRGYVVAHCQNNIVSLIGQTKGTRASLPERGVNVNDITLSAFYEPRTFGTENSVCYVWKKRDSLVVPDRPTDDWRTILARMLEAIPDERRVTAHTRINAIVGYRLGRHPKGTAASIVYKDVVKAFENRTDHDEDVAALQKHPAFESYVLARIHERAEMK